MQDEGCQPNVVTYNTLIDVYGKMGRWEDAVRVLGDMIDKVAALWLPLVLVLVLCLWKTRSRQTVIVLQAAHQDVVA